MEQNKIQTLTITDLLGMNFYIPDYQRGYRWTRNNVTQLLNDIWEYRQNGDNRGTFYCLQPVVVRKRVWEDADGKTVNGYELIDGQQRLTTIHRILTCIFLERYGKIDLIARGYDANLFSIYYQTRLMSKTFLEKATYDGSIPDLYYLSEAYACTKEWFLDKIKGIPDDTMDEVRKLLLPSNRKDPEWCVKVIWYEVNDETQQSEALFIRLNRGKIPLTSAELIKARFVNSESMKDLDNEVQIQRKSIFINLWDEMEAQLHNETFWAFISNIPSSAYFTKIEVLFDAITGRKPGETDPLYSYTNFFKAREDSKSLWQKWLQVEEVYRSLIYWFHDKYYYHKIGFLIATGTNIRALIKMKGESLKTDFKNAVNQHIAKKIPENWEELRFDKQADKASIATILLLHNLDKLNPNSHEVFPFLAYKNMSKSLEHIHAQNIEDIDPRNQGLWVAWLTEHLAILKDLVQDDAAVLNLQREILEIIPKLDFVTFKLLGNKILGLFPTEEGNHSDYLHRIENLALLGLNENIALSNSVFELKRRKVVELDKKGSFLPIATKRIFLKYYTGNHNNHQSIWTSEERSNYKADIRQTIEKYLLHDKTLLNEI